MMELRYRAKGTKETVDLKELLGESVISKNGQWIGSVTSVHIDPRLLSVEGVTVSRGFMEQPEYIGREYFHVVSNRGIVLNIDPVTEVVGLAVYDARGKWLGEVKSVERKNSTNEVSHIEVDRGLFAKPLIFSKETIKDIGRGIVLNVAVQG